MRNKKKAEKKHTHAGKNDALGKYIRQLELDLGGLGYEIERERPLEITELLERIAPNDAAYEKRFADRVGRPVWLMVRVTVKPRDKDFERYKSLLLSRNRANCVAFEIKELKNGDIQYTIVWANGRAGTQNDARVWAAEIFGYRSKEEKDRFIQIETLLIFKMLGWGTSTIGISTAGRKRFVSPAPASEGEKGGQVA
jgi:hypothetical protein